MATGPKGGMATLAIKGEGGDKTSEGTQTAVPSGPITRVSMASSDAFEDTKSQGEVSCPGIGQAEATISTRIVAR